MGEAAEAQICPLEAGGRESVEQLQSLANGCVFDVVVEESENPASRANATWTLLSYREGGRVAAECSMVTGVVVRRVS